MWALLKSLVSKLIQGSMIQRKRGSREYATPTDFVQALLADWETSSDCSFGWVSISIHGAPDKCIEVAADGDEWVINVVKPSEALRQPLHELCTKQFQRFRSFRVADTCTKRACELRGKCSQDNLAHFLLALFQAVHGWSGDPELEGHVDGL